MSRSQLETACATLSAGPQLLAIADTHPELVDSLLSIAAATLQQLETTTVGKPVPKPGNAAAAAPTATTAAAPPQLGAPFVCVADVSCVVPRGKFSFDVSEAGFVLRSKGDAASAATYAIATSNVSGVFYLANKDKYNAGPSGTTHGLVIMLDSPIMVGKTAHKALAVVETGANLAKSGAVALRLQRAPNAAALRNAAALDLVDASASSSSVSSVALELEAEHSMAVLRRLFAAVIGTVGELDPKVFKSFNGEATIKCYHKVNDGFLFPLRRAIIFGLKQLVVIPHTDIASASVNRVGGAATKSFDLNIELTDGKKVQFSMIANEELEPLRSYISTRTFGGGASSKSAAADAPSSAAAAAPSADAAALSTTPPSKSNAPQAQPATAPVANINDMESDDEAAGGGAGISDEDDDEDSDAEYNGVDSDEDAEAEAEAEGGDGTEDEDDDDEEEDADDDSDVPDDQDAASPAGFSDNELNELLEDAGPIEPVSRKRGRRAAAKEPKPQPGDDSAPSAAKRAATAASAPIDLTDG